jgi:aspartyl-tRNA(Asn)/glutamyl-tRNA(Gln) amidotransferase subunit A
MNYKELTSDAHARAGYIEKIRTVDQNTKAFLELDVQKGLGKQDASGPLSGLPFAVKDNIAVKDFKATCGSKILENFVSPYDATAVARLKNAGAHVIGKTNLDEFGMGSSCDNSALAVSSNPWNLNKVCGGSSGGSASAVAMGLVPFALGSDTGGSVREPAMFCGVYGLKPTYGAVSRYGLIAYASSLEQIGVFSRETSILRDVFSVIKGRDPMDQTSVEIPSVEKAGSPVIAFLEEEEGLSEEMKIAYREYRDKLKQAGFSLQSVKMKTLEYSIPAYYTIATAEASANLARYTGIRYGSRAPGAASQEELVRVTRDQGFGAEVKLRILLGTYVLRSGFQDQYYHKAQKIRTAIRKEFEHVFTRASMILMPVFPTQAFSHGNSGLSGFQQKIADKYTVTANLAGLPGLAVPAGVYGGLPAGFQLMGSAFSEDLLIDTAAKMESLFGIEKCPHGMGA